MPGVVGRSVAWRAIGIVAALSAATGGSVSVAAGSARAASEVPAAGGAGATARADGVTPPDDPARGLVYSGVQRAGDGDACRGKFTLRDRAPGVTACTHGPDPAPPGFDVRLRRELPKGEAQPAAAAAPAAVQCHGDGVSGKRVQLVYARAVGVADRYSQVAPTFRQAAGQLDEVFNASAAETGGSRHVRFVTDQACFPVVANVVLTGAGDDNMNNTISELAAQGYNRPDRKYLVWVDANVYCGIAQIYGDDRAGQENYNNGNPQAAGMVARVDNGCWNLAGQSIEAHELMHTLGGVQSSAPNATTNGHCTDDRDRMCYDDGSGAVIRTVCADLAHENRFDCNHDDYFHTAPAGGSYLATHWNPARSAFLEPAGATPSPKVPVTDFDGNGTTDVAVFRPSSGIWFVQNGPAAQWGTNGDIPVPGDYDGNGTTDVAVYRPASGVWFVQGRPAVGYGTLGDLPVPGDYDGNGTTDVAVYRPASGVWFVQGRPAVAYGTLGDVPVPGDYDGNGTTDVAVYRPASGVWFVQGRPAVAYGTLGDVPVPGDYDGNGTTDVAVYRPASGVWFVQGRPAVAYGTLGDVPVPGDYDGNGTTDVAVYRPASGVWFVQGRPAVGYGTLGDVPLPLPGAIRLSFFPAL